MTTDNNLLGSGDQEAQLEEALKVVRREAFEMKRWLDRERLIDALKHAQTMLGELKTNTLSPKFYYRLYIDSTNELQHLESFLTDLAQRGNCPLELYENVQYAQSIVPRLYLMITIGVVHMKAGMVNKTEILHDLVEMCRGVQHPLRGLFLRNYLVSTTRNLLPDDAQIKKMEDGSVTDAIHFFLTNFGEMNKLWGPSKEKEKRERERMELRILVGTNMVRLSQLENLKVDTYLTRVLPGVLEQVVSCHDPISQEYLMECVIQVFPDEFHLASLREFLSACKELHEEVNMKNVLSCVMERVQTLAAAHKETQLFSLFAETAHSLISTRNMPTEDIISLHISLSTLAFKCYLEQVEYASTVYDSLLRILNEKGIAEQSSISPIGRELIKVLDNATQAYGHVGKIVQLKSFEPLMNLLDVRARCRVSASILECMIERELFIQNEEELNGLEVIMAPLIDDDSVKLTKDDIEGEDFQDEQNTLGKAIHLVRFDGDDPDGQFLLLSLVRKLVGRGGIHRIPFTLPSLLFALFKLATLYKEKKCDVENWDMKMRKVMILAMNCIKKLHEIGGKSDIPLRLYIEAALVTDTIPFEDSPSIVYEFLSKSLSIVEEELSDSRSRLSSLFTLTCAIEKTRSLSHDDVLKLANHIALISSNLFKKADQVRALCSCASLFWSTRYRDEDGEEKEMRDGEKVHSVLTRALKMGAQCMEPIVQVELLIDILTVMYSFYSDGCNQITEDSIVEVVGRVRDSKAQLEKSVESERMDGLLNRSLEVMEGNIVSRMRM
ncbi:vps-35 [Pristionchus pacificus]|uniref:Vacuolar protein sorting-associated protein 35 n=1 Tax=Pristionchus pacificus TaxID=54126 RepID=A0A2A6CJ12_PRIPA|nr:vps-35 [Pristionchus pacificus]|eukprot:PDM78090.1 vps-35 [Pristionchus pacificus]